MAGIRVTGLASGLDTESLVQQLSDAYQTKVDNAKKQQTKAEWKKEAWASLNTKIYSFYKDSLNMFKSTSTYNTKSVSGELSGVKITAGNKAVNGTHKVKVNSTASAQMWTGDAIKMPTTNEDGTTTTVETAAAGSTKLTELGIGEGTKYTVTVGGEETTIEVGENTTLSSFASELSKLGLNANYDAGQGRFYISAKDTGTASAFNIKSTGTNAMSALGLKFKEGNGAGRIAASNAEIVYNGVTYIQSNNSFSINGLTIEATEAAGEDEPAQTITVSTDAQGIYDKVKSFLKEYNSLISEMNKLYSADSSRGYEPLTSDEKEAMSDDEVEQWETKIKDSLLRRDSTIGNLLSSMRTTLNKSVEVTNPDGTTTRYNLASFGIETGDYTEKGQLHIYGDSDDSTYADKDDKLLAAIMANPDAVTQTLTTLGSEMYTNLQNAMKRTELSSALTFYNDKQLDSEISDYKDKVTELQEKLQEEEDRYYEQFSAMEKAMTQLQSKQNYISQLFSG